MVYSLLRSCALAASLSLAVAAEPLLTAKEFQKQEGAHTAQALTDPEPDLLEEYNVTANRRRQPRAQTSESITVITRSDIEALTPLAQTLPELLRLVPGVQAEIGRAHV